MRGDSAWALRIGDTIAPTEDALIAEVFAVFHRALLPEFAKRNGINPLAARHVDALNAAHQGALFGPAPAPADPAPAPADPATSRELFERWWKEYPPHRKLEKIRTWVIWSRIEPKFTESMVEAMVALLHRQRQHPDWIKEGGAFVPYPSRYLARGRWMDECVRMASVPRGDVDNAFALAAWLESKKRRMLE